MNSSTPVRYARALADVAGEAQLEQQVQEELSAFSKLLDSHKELSDTFSHPAIPFAAKRNIVQEIGRRIPVAQIVVNFILILLEQRRIHQLQEVVEAYGDVLDEMHGILRGHVFSSEKLEKGVRQRLQKVASGVTGKEVKINFHVDELLIGGLKLQIGSTIYDGSLQNQLEEMRRRIAER